MRICDAKEEESVRHYRFYAHELSYRVVREDGD
jgi:hypothetical protein